MQVVSEKSKANITTAEHVSFYTSDDQFGIEQGLNLAVGLSFSFSSRNAFLRNGTVDPSYGEIKAYVESWVTNEEGFIYNYTEIKTHPCANEEIVLDGRQNSKFMTVVHD